MKKRAAVLLVLVILIAMFAGGCSDAKKAYPITVAALKALLGYDNFGALEGIWEPNEIWD